MHPGRRRGFEHLDDRALDPALVRRSWRDIERSNQWLGGTAAAVGAARELVAGLATGTPLTLLDVGAGAGDVSTGIAASARRDGRTLRTFALEYTAARAAGVRGAMHITAGDARRLPIASASVDITLVALLLHHFDDDDAAAVLREAHRVSRIGVVVSDLRRSVAAAAGLWLASWPLAFHAVSRHDGVTSVMRGFTDGELSALVRRAVGVEPRVVRRPLYRLTATWRIP